MWILPLVGYLGLVIGFLFLTLSIASGLYYLSELVEEHSVLSAKVLQRLIYIIIGFHTLLWLVDGFPWHLILLSIASHAVYASNLRHFPIVKLTDPLFILSCALVVVNHWLWFRFFSSPDAFRRKSFWSNAQTSTYAGGLYGQNYSYYNQPTFTEIASYFGLCVWLVPFSLFVSLSAGENVLPSMGSEYATGGRDGVGAASASGPYKKGHKRRNTGLAKAAVGSAREWVSETAAVMGVWKNDKVKSFN